MDRSGDWRTIVAFPLVCDTEDEAVTWIEGMESAAAGGVDLNAAMMTLAEYGTLDVLKRALRGLEDKSLAVVPNGSTGTRFDRWSRRPPPSFYELFITWRDNRRRRCLSFHILGYGPRFPGCPGGR